MPVSKSNAVMEAHRIGSVTLLVLLIGVVQFCQASREQPARAGLTSEALSGSKKKSSDSTPINTIGDNEKSSTTTLTTSSSKGESEDFETDDMTNGHIKFDNLRESVVQEGVLDGPAPSPSNAFLILPSIVTPTLALSIVVLATKVFS